MNRTQVNFMAVGWPDRIPATQPRVPVVVETNLDQDDEVINQAFTAWWQRCKLRKVHPDWFENSQVGFQAGAEYGANNDADDVRRIAADRNSEELKSLKRDLFLHHGVQIPLASLRAGIIWHLGRHNTGITPPSE